MDWRVRYLVKYPDMNRKGESMAYSRAGAYQWVQLASKDILEIEILKGQIQIGKWVRNERGNLSRVWR